MVAILAMAASAIPYSTIMTLPSFLSLSPSVLKKVSQGLVSFELARQVDTRASQSQPHTQSFMPSVTPDEIPFHGQRPCRFLPSLVFLPQALRCVLCEKCARCVELEFMKRMANARSEARRGNWLLFPPLE